MFASLKNKNYIVIGAGSSVGEVLCRELVNAGANLHAAFRSESKYADCSLIRTAKYKFDLGEPSEVKDFIKKIKDGLNHIDGLIVCSGTDISSPLKLSSQEMIEKAFQMNLFSIMDICKHLLFSRKPDTTGASIVFISSVAASRGFFGKTIYSAYKGALVSFARSLATEVAERKIRVNTISPGTFSSDMSEKVFNAMDQEKVNELGKLHPLGFGKPKDVADAILFLLSDESKWITGTDMIVDGGFSIR